MGSGSNTERTVIVAALIGAAATIIAALIAIQPWKIASGSPAGPDFTGVPPGFGEVSVFLSKEAGPVGSKISVSGEGYAPGEKVDVSFHTDIVATTTANGAGRFSGVEITVPSGYKRYVGQQFLVIATGRSSLATGKAPFTVSG